MEGCVFELLSFFVGGLEATDIERHGFTFHFRQLAGYGVHDGIVVGSCPLTKSLELVGNVALVLSCQAGQLLVPFAMFAMTGFACGNAGIFVALAENVFAYGSEQLVAYPV